MIIFHSTRANIKRLLSCAGKSKWSYAAFLSFFLLPNRGLPQGSYFRTGSNDKVMGKDSFWASLKFLQSIKCLQNLCAHSKGKKIIFSCLIFPLNWNPTGLREVPDRRTAHAPAWQAPHHPDVRHRRHPHLEAGMSKPTSSVSQK